MATTAVGPARDSLHTEQHASDDHSKAHTPTDKKIPVNMGDMKLDRCDAHRSIMGVGQGRGAMGGIQGEVMEGLGGAAGGGVGGHAGACQAVGVDGRLGGTDADGTALQHLQGHHKKKAGRWGARWNRACQVITFAACQQKACARWRLLQSVSMLEASTCRPQRARHVLGSRLAVVSQPKQQPRLADRPCCFGAPKMLANTRQMPNLSNPTRPCRFLNSKMSIAGSQHLSFPFTCQMPGLASATRLCNLLER